MQWSYTLVLLPTGMRSVWNVVESMKPPSESRMKEDTNAAAKKWLQTPLQWCFARSIFPRSWPRCTIEESNVKCPRMQVDFCATTFSFTLCMLQNPLIFRFSSCTCRPSRIWTMQHRPVRLHHPHRTFDSPQVVRVKHIKVLEFAWIWLHFSSLKPISIP